MAEYDCVACGKCCFHAPNYVELFPEDLVRLGDKRTARFAVKSTLSKAQRRPGEHDGTRFMRMENGHCAALEITHGAFLCSIYEDRPLLCRVFEPGSPSCLEARGELPAG